MLYVFVRVVAAIHRSVSLEARRVQGEPAAAAQRVRNGGTGAPAGGGDGRPKQR